MPMHELNPEERARADRERLLLSVLQAVAPQSGPIVLEVDASDKAAVITISYRYRTTDGAEDSEHEIAQIITLSAHTAPIEPAAAPADPMTVAQDLANSTRGIVTVSKAQTAPAESAP